MRLLMVGAVLAYGLGVAASVLLLEVGINVNRIGPVQWLPRLIPGLQLHRG